MSGEQGIRLRHTLEKLAGVVEGDISPILVGDSVKFASGGLAMYFREAGYDEKSVAAMQEKLRGCFLRVADRIANTAMVGQKYALNIFEESQRILRHSQEIKVYSGNFGIYSDVDPKKFDESRRPFVTVAGA